MTVALKRSPFRFKFAPKLCPKSGRIEGQEAVVG